MQLYSLFLLICLLPSQIFGGTVVSGGGKWTHGLNLEEDHGVKFRWRNSKEGSNGQYWLVMEFSARASGYVGVGFSPHGGMDGGDMAIVFKDSDGIPSILDFHGIGNGAPFQDSQQDVTLLDYETKNGWTTFSFKRPWDTCDPQDMVITNDTMRLIWAYSDSKPVIRGGEFQASYHGPAKRGAKSIIVADGGVIPTFPDENPELYPGVKIWDYRMDKAIVEPQNTTYYCKMVKFTDTGRKHHMIGWKPLIQKENINNVHHIIAFECQVPAEEVALFDEHTASHPGGTCYTANMPAPWGRNCVGLSLVWVVGSDGEMLPQHVGAPLGQEHGGATYFMIEMHYENPGGQKKTDSSGIRVFYTDQLRKDDGGVLLLGYRHSPFLLIPPRQDNVVINGVCGSECTSKMIPPTGIRLVNTMVHMHLVGDKIRLRHIRNGVELPIIAEDNYYDFNYQQSRTLKNELVVLPGDELLTECEYKTTNKERYVVGGLATHQEMCQIFFFYYPRLPLTQCTSQYEFHSFFKGLGIDSVEGEILKPLHMPYEPDLLPLEDREKDLGDDAKELEAIEEGVSFKSVFNFMNITNPPNLRGKTVGKYLEEVGWTQERAKELEKFWKDGQQYQFCSKPGLKRVVLDKHIINYPKITHPLVHEQSAFCRDLTSASPLSIGGLAMGALLVVILIVIVIFVVRKCRSNKSADFFAVEINMKRLDLILGIFLLFTSIEGGVSTNGSEVWTHQVNLVDDFGVKFRWRNVKEETDGQYWLVMEFSAKASGYVGVGLSPHGGMDGGDMAIVFKDSDGTPTILDFHGIGNGHPTQDTQQDYTLLSFENEGGWITFTFKRPWDTCDPNDMVITDDTMRLIWAYSNSKPVVRGGIFNAPYHGAINRGAKSVILSDGGALPPFPDENPTLYPGVKMWDFHMDNETITPKSTTYLCKIVKFTDTSKKHHMIGWKPLIQKENLNIVHHMVVFECSVPASQVPDFDEYHASHPGGTCYTANMPSAWSKHCVAFLLAWVVGSEGEMLPSHVGSPLGQEHGGATYFMVETHYENLGHGYTTDSSGIRLFYTDELRQYDGGVMLIGHQGHSPFLLIPPKQDNFVVNGLCGTECTEKTIPPSGIKVVNTLVHMHLAGKKIRLRHFRNGVELPVIAEDNYYDFNYQQSRTLKNELLILPSDEMVVECEYHTTDVDKYIIGGLATHQEMCQVFFFYYPRVPLAQCMSQYEFHDFFKGLHIDAVEGDVLKRLNVPYEPAAQVAEEDPEDIRDLESAFNYMNITSPLKLRGKTVGQLLEQTKWTGEKGTALQKQWKNGRYYQYCSKADMKNVMLNKHIINYPTITQALKKETSAVCRNRNTRLTSGASSFTFDRVRVAVTLFPIIMLMK
ncbi:hypothetical protein Ocin01_06550 [Orchesella cincta]|uniref:DOMON domain-containing protein n=1 Tax=Orchesella cincta TaxID=48709 RepID=A0A1D2N4D0_ORCCI|nr:hypothetical protein Ocin01_06550 [Orchesella cincta]